MHIDRIFQSDDFEIIDIGVIGVFEGIVKRQCPFFSVGIAENEFEDSVFMMIIYTHLKKSPRLILNLTIFRFILNFNRWMTFC